MRVEGSELLERMQEDHEVLLNRLFDEVTALVPVSTRLLKEADRRADVAFRRVALDQVALISQAVGMVPQVTEMVRKAAVFYLATEIMRVAEVFDWCAVERDRKALEVWEHEFRQSVIKRDQKRAA